ncbi:MAG: gas vesicle protein GvpG [Myxococcales bacterium]|nr:gas vesicle protein GvpG [Myxococcales bacterium]
MIVIDDLLAAPLRGALWVLKEIVNAAEEDQAAQADRIRETLRELYQQLERGQISEADFDAQERVLLDRLDELEPPEDSEEEDDEEDDEGDDEEDDEDDEEQDEDDEEQDEDEDEDDATDPAEDEDADALANSAAMDTHKLKDSDRSEQERTPSQEKEAAR